MTNGGWGWGDGSSIRQAGVGFLVQDLFTDSDDTTLPNHTPDIDTVGTGWQESDAGITIESNKASDNQVTAGEVIDAGTGDVIIEVDMVIQGGGNGFNGVHLRWKDATHFLIAGMDVTFNKVTIWENDGGVWNERSGNGNGSGPALAAGQSRSLKVTASGTSISVEVDDTEEATATLAFQQAETHHGLYNDTVGGGTDATWENFRIEAN